ncbi:hypothetical protein [Streptomyces sp. V3I7]|nr:hypothetical protein [Streptomyces sp. V3I7]MDQ0991769.1 hypothetical protein [Streptomyces sp. V3I7]
MPTDPYAVLRALVRAEAQRSMPKPETSRTKQPQRPVKRDRG